MQIKIDVLWVTVFKCSLRNISRYTDIKITTNFSDDVAFLHAFYLKFTINANIAYITVEATFSMFIVCPDHYGQYF